jgi:hypothetical protein
VEASRASRLCLPPLLAWALPDPRHLFPSCPLLLLPDPSSNALSHSLQPTPHLCPQTQA